MNHHIAQCQTLNQMDDVELLCFYVLKYAYFIRNKYFYTGKGTALFYIKNIGDKRNG